VVVLFFLFPPRSNIHEERLNIIMQEDQS